MEELVELREVEEQQGGGGGEDGGGGGGGTGKTEGGGDGGGGGGGVFGFERCSHRYCGGGLPSASQVKVARWSGELTGRTRSLGSALHLGPWNVTSSVQAGWVRGVEEVKKTEV